MNLHRNGDLKLRITLCARPAFLRRWAAILNGYLFCLAEFKKDDTRSMSIETTLTARNPDTENIGARTEFVLYTKYRE